MFVVLKWILYSTRYLLQTKVDCSDGWLHGFLVALPPGHRDNQLRHGTMHRCRAAALKQHLQKKATAVNDIVKVHSGLGPDLLIPIGCS